MSKNDDLVRRLRERDADWQKQCDGWFSNPDFASTETEAAVRRTLYCEAADAIERGAAHRVADRAAMIVEGWSTAQNHLPDGVDGGWLADRDLEMGKAIRSLSTPPAPAPDAGEEKPVAWFLNLWNEADEDLKGEVHWGRPSPEEIKQAEHGGHDIEYLYGCPSPTPQPPAVEAEGMVYAPNVVTAVRAAHETVTNLEAAIKAKTDEIERLKAQLAEADSHAQKIEALLDPHVAWDGEPPKAQVALRDEIERLRRELEPIREVLAERCGIYHTPEFSVCSAEQMRNLAHRAARVSAAEASNKALREGLEWYGEQARLCRLIHREGDAGREALSDDGGRRARTLLSETGGE